jgi:hypothetical protein
MRLTVIEERAIREFADGVVFGGKPPEPTDGPPVDAEDAARRRLVSLGLPAFLVYDLTTVGMIADEFGAEATVSFILLSLGRVPPD